MGDAGKNTPSPNYNIVQETELMLTSQKMNTHKKAFFIVDRGKLIQPN